MYGREKNNKVIRRLVHENLTKNRLMKAEPQWVAARQEKLKA